jgi:hypothetical protein
MNIWAFVKNAVTRATPAPVTPRGDRETVAWLHAQTARNDVDSLPPAPVGMSISNEALHNLTAPSPAQRGHVAVELSRISPPTGDTGAELAKRFPAGTWGQ